MNGYIQQQTIKIFDIRGEIFGSNRLWKILTLSLGGVVLITVLQDFIHSQLKNYSFYLAESLLFKVFWVLFLPGLFLQLASLQKTNFKTRSRIVATGLIPTMIHLLSVPLIVWALSALFFSHTYSYYKILTYTLSEDFYKMPLIYGLSVAAACYRFSVKKAEAKEDFESPSIPFAVTEPEIQEIQEIAETPPYVFDKIVVSSGRKRIAITVSDIFYFSAATPYIEIHLENKFYAHAETLKAINEKLDKKQFVRVHKSTVVNLKKVVSCKSRLNGDYDLLLENKTEIRLSRNYAREFKKLFNRTSAG